MSHEFNRIWNAYLRGQLVLGIIVALITAIALAILGVQNSLALGILTGILQVIPYVGPVVAMALTAVVSFFQPGNYLGLAPFQYALVVTIVSIVLQNIQAALLVPRVVGVALDLSPLLVLLSLLAGGALAGILGMLLAAPVVATIKLVARYVWRKLLDLPPFPDPVARPEPPPPTLSRLRDWLNRQHTKAPKQQPSE
jgi:predicted PurR-regulated permease PerM